MRPHNEADRAADHTSRMEMQAGARSRTTRRRVIPPAHSRVAPTPSSASTPSIETTTTKLQDTTTTARPRPRTATSSSSRSNPFSSITSAAPKPDGPPLLMRDSTGSIVQQIPQISMHDPQSDADSEYPAEEAEQEAIDRDARLSGQVQEYLAKHDRLALWDAHGLQKNVTSGSGGAGRHATRGQTHAVDVGGELADQVMGRLREVVGDKLAEDRWRYESTADVFARQAWA